MGNLAIGGIGAWLFISSTQAKKITQLMVGQSTIIHGYRISCRSKNPSFKQMREDG